MNQYRVVSDDEFAKIQGGPKRSWSILRRALCALQKPADWSGLEWIEVPVRQGESAESLRSNIFSSLSSATHNMRITTAIREGRVFVRPRWPNIDKSLDNQ